MYALIIGVNFFLITYVQETLDIKIVSRFNQQDAELCNLFSKFNVQEVTLLRWYLFVQDQKLMKVTGQDPKAFDSNPIPNPFPAKNKIK